MCVFLMSIMLCSPAHAVGIPHFSISDAVNSAEVIVVAKVGQVRDIGLAPPIRVRTQLLNAEEYSADLSVLRTLKGPPLDNITVTYSLPLTFIGDTGLTSGTRMLFLNPDAGHYDLADPFYPSFPATLEAPEESAPPQSVSEMVLSNMLAVLASANTSSSEKYEILRIYYALPSNEKTIAALRKGLATSPTDLELSVRLEGELIRFGDLSQLPTIVNQVTQHLTTSAGRELLLYVIGNFLQNARAVHDLDPLLSSPDDAVREATVEALWHIGTPVVVPALVQKLADPSEKVQYYAVRGLSDIANEYGWGGPSEEEFHEHGQKYLTHWREWAKTHV